jgi:transcriptional regulator with XRE-family HTH domain
MIAASWAMAWGASVDFGYLPTTFTGMALQTVDFLFERTGISVEEIAERTCLSFDRVLAIAEGRWTPSPQEREKIAAAFEISVAEVSWGHSINPRNIRYHRHGLKENF